MDKIIITDRPDDFSDYDADQIINVSDFIATASEAWSNYDTEFIPYRICNAITALDPVFAIDYRVNSADKFLIANHLITSLNPVLFFVTDSDVDISDSDDISGLIKCNFIKIVQLDKLKQLYTEPDYIKQFCQVYHDNFDYISYKENYQRFLTLDRHQAVNEWGAIKLLLNHGLTLSQVSQSFEYPQTVYFKQKLKEHNITQNTAVDVNSYSLKTDLNREKAKFVTNSSSIKRILLIDDNADRGWSFAIQTLFSHATVDIKFSFDEANSITDFSTYDFIFLDLRLPSNSNQKTPTIENGIKLIENIKGAENSLNVPLMIFTASQKASTLKHILEKGADAMFVKESPDLDFEASLDSYLNFISELNVQISKGNVLKKYWLNILKIKNNLLPEVADQGPILLSSRILERLEMFYGLIKNGLEQYPYNEGKFHFSSDVLSYMTLWSILNEIQECYYDKIQSTLNLFWNNTRRTYTPLTKRPVGGQPPVNFTYTSKWHIKGQPTEIYFEKTNISVKTNDTGGFRTDFNGDYLIDSDTICYLSFSQRSPFYETRDFSGNYKKANTYQPEQKLSFQIAFLLLEKQQLKSSPNLAAFQKTLKEANELRNKLYLTHGENSSNNFHTQLEKSKVHITSDIEKLFSLISFLLTGKEF